MRGPLVETTVLVARIALAIVFGIAGVAKLRDREQFRGAVRAFGVPPVLIDAAVYTVPLLELAIALGLVTPLALPAAVAACALLALFTGGIAVSLARGRTPECRCFGQIHAQPIGPMTLVRNAIFAALAGAIVWGGPALAEPGTLVLLAALIGISPAAVLLSLCAVAAIIAQAILQWNLLQQHGRLLWRLDHLERQLGVAGVPSHPANTAATIRLRIGAVAPSFDLPSSSGGRLSLEQLRHGGLPVMLIFSNPACHACKAFLPAVRDWQVRYATQMRLAVVSETTNESEHIQGLRTVVFQHHNAISDAYGVTGTPAAVMVRADGTIGSAVMLGGEGIATLLPALPVAGEADYATLSIEAVI